MISWMPPTSYWIPDQFFGSRIFGSEDDGTQPAADLTSFFSTTTKKIYTLTMYSCEKIVDPNISEELES